MSTSSALEDWGASEVFAEILYVEVSSDGTQFARFPVHDQGPGSPMGALRGLAEACPLALDGSGVLSMTFVNPGGLEGNLVLQALTLDASGVPRGTSAAVFN